MRGRFPNWCQIFRIWSLIYDGKLSSNFCCNPGEQAIKKEIRKLYPVCPNISFFSMLTSGRFPSNSFFFFLITALFQKSSGPTFSPSLTLWLRKELVWIERSWFKRDLAVQLPSSTTRGHFGASEAQSAEGWMRSCERTQELKICRLCHDCWHAMKLMTHGIKVAENEIVTGCRHS